MITRLRNSINDIAREFLQINTTSLREPITEANRQAQAIGIQDDPELNQAIDAVNDEERALETLLDQLVTNPQDLPAQVDAFEARIQGGLRNTIDELVTRIRQQHQAWTTLTQQHRQAGTLRNNLNGLLIPDGDPAGIGGQMQAETQVTDSIDERMRRLRETILAPTDLRAVETTIDEITRKLQHGHAQYATNCPDNG